VVLSSCAAPCAGAGRKLNFFLTEHVSAKFSFEVFNLTNTTSFDIPINNVSQNPFVNDFPVYGTPAMYDIHNCSPAPPTFYACATFSGLGVVNKTIGSPRQIQMSLQLTFEPPWFV